MDNYNGLNENEKGSQTSTGYYGNYPVNDGNPNGGGQGNNGKKKKKSHPMAFVLVAALLIGGSAGGGVYLGNMLSAKQAVSNQAIAPTETAKEAETKNTVTLATTKDSGNEVATASDVSGVVENVMPSIVSISNVYDTVATNVFGQT